MALTDEGWSMVASMWKVYGSAIAARLQASLSVAEIETLVGLLSKLRSEK